MANNLYESPVFICGHRKSGTTLLLCLLDNHPELLVYPADSAFFYGYYPRYDTNEFTSEQKISRMVDFVLYQLEYEIKLLPEDFQNEINFPIEQFKEEFINLVKKTELKPKDMLKCLFESYHRNWKKTQNAKFCIEKTTSTEIYANEIIQWFPNAKFIHVIRDPRDNWGSLKSGWDKRYQKFNDDLNRLMQSMIDRGKLGMELAEKNQKVLGADVYKIIKYEDLTNNPIKELQELSNFIGISYHSFMEQPTVCGQLWKGNNFDGHSFDKPSTINVGKWAERTTKEEAQLIEFYFADLMNKYGYEAAFSLKEQVHMATQHYKWFNFAQLFSASESKPE